jgi:general secretion pathway protein G
MFFSRKYAAQRAAGKVMTRRQRAWRRRGFSFIEIMVVVVIMGLLAAAVTLKVADYMDTARTNRARSDLATIVDAIETFQLKNGRYPTNEEGLSKLPLKNCTDPWGNPYEYNSPAQNEPYEVVCYGADGRKDGEGANADIYSWQLDSKKGGK